ncbi:KR domain-containing protein [Streptomyces thinghirensis]|nr:KR domain-containing protein [Streptomyces thinghirensis]
MYLITGGAGGLGRVFARDIARRAPGAVLCLTGRSPLGPAIETELAALRAEERAPGVPRARRHGRAPPSASSAS